MTDKALFDLDAAGRWRLAYDSNQWIIEQRRGTRRKDAADRAGQELWRGITFIGGPKSGLWRSFRELEIMLTDDALTRVDALPDDFLTWWAQARQKEARHLDAARGVSETEDQPPDAPVPAPEIF